MQCRLVSVELSPVFPRPTDDDVPDPVDAPPVGTAVPVLSKVGAPDPVVKFTFEGSEDVPPRVSSFGKPAVLTPESVKLPLIVSSKGDENSFTPVTLIFVIEASKGNSSLSTFGKFNIILTNSIKFGISKVTTEVETTSIDGNSVLFTLISVQDSEVIFFHIERVLQ